ncbi:hypothetical protein T08_60 [Trichinella sp. T8]|nr:hypothetical protein T08_60 [Trichinella sp. T8]
MLDSEKSTILDLLKKEEAFVESSNDQLLIFDSTLKQAISSIQLTPPAKSPIMGEYGLKSKFNTNVLLPG